MYQRLLKYTEDFKATETIFKVHLTQDVSSSTLVPVKSSLTLVPVKKFKPTPIPNDPLSEVVCSSFEEYMDFLLHDNGTKHLTKIRYSYNVDEILKKSINYIKERMFMFLQQNLESKKPKQTSLYRWLNNNQDSPEVLNTFIDLYEKIKPYCDNKMFIHDPENRKHAVNAIAALQSLKNRHV